MASCNLPLFQISQMYEVAPMKGDSVDWKRFIKLIKYGGDFEEEA